MVGKEAKLLGIEIGGTKIQLFVLNNDCNPIEKISVEVGQGTNAKDILGHLANHIEEIKVSHELVGVGVGFGGPVNVHTGVITKSYQVQGWDNFNLKHWIKQIVDIPIIIDNDTNIAALAEAEKGAGVSHKHVLYITLGSGVGGGFVTDGNIYRGKNSSALEIGHLRIDKSGATVESRCSGWGLNSILNKYLAANPFSPLGKLHSAQNIDASKLLIDAIALGDEGAKFIFEQFVDDLSFGLSHAIHLLAPNVIIIGGGLMGLGDLLIERLDESVPTYLMESMKVTKQLIVLADLQSDVVPIGAGVLIKKNLKT